MPLNGKKEKDINYLYKKKLEIDKQISKTINKLIKLKDVRKNISQILIPRLFQKHGVSSFELEDGSNLELRSSYELRNPSLYNEQVCKWLKREGYENLIRNNVRVSFKGEEKKAIKLFKELKRKGFYPNLNKKVEPMTIKAFVREQHEKNGQNLKERFGVFTFYKTNICN